MPLQSPLSIEQHDQVITATEQFIHKGSELFEQRFPLIPVHFDLIGRSAGMYRYSGQQRIIRYNPFLFEKYFLENLKVTVPHEVAHYLTDMMYGYRHVKPHGKEWKRIMHAFGVTPTVRCQFNMQGIPVRRLKYYDYHCQCRTHMLSSIRHNRILNERAIYYCKNCNHQLVEVMHA